MKKLLIAGGLILSSYGASGGIITAGGIQWDDDPIGVGGISAQVKFQQWFTNTATLDTGGINTIVSDAAVIGAIGTELVGIGEFDQFSDGRGASTFCVSGSCELTYSFGGIIATGINTFDISNAWLNVYIDETPDFNSATALPSTAHADFADAQNGTLWASFSIDLFSLQGSLTGGEVDVGLTLREGVALFDVESALDYSNFLDILYTAGATFVDGSLYTLDGNGQLINAVPEPTGIALFSLGLLGLAGLSRHKRS